MRDIGEWFDMRYGDVVTDEEFKRADDHLASISPHWRKERVMTFNDLADELSKGIETARVQYPSERLDRLESILMTLLDMLSAKHDPE